MNRRELMAGVAATAAALTLPGKALVAKPAPAFTIVAGRAYHLVGKKIVPGPIQYDPVPESETSTT